MIRLLAIRTTLIMAMAASVQQAVAGPAGPEGEERSQLASQDDVPIVSDMLQGLTARLELTAEQQTRITPILQRLHDIQQSLVDNKSLSREERLVKVTLLRYQANEEIREIVNEVQKKKLDQYLQGPHPEMHGNLSGANPAPN